MVRGRFRERDVGLMILGGILLLTDRTKAPNPVEDSDEIAREPATASPDRGLQVDRLATRVGAYSVVAIAGYPVLRLGWLLGEAWWRDLPIVLENYGWVILLMVFASMVAAVLFFFGFATILTVIEMMGQPRTWWGILGRAVVAVLGIYCLIVTGALIAMGDSISISFNKLSDSLALMPVCDQEKIAGHICQNALDRCVKSDATNPPSCGQAIQRYLQELRPTTGRNP